MNKSKKDLPESVIPPGYTKDELYHAKRYRHQRDLITALLEEGCRYSFEETDTIIHKFLKGKVK